MSSPAADRAPAAAPPSDDASCASAKLKSLIQTGATDFRVVFLYPLCTGIMTGVGFILGKRLGEKYFYGGVGKSP